MTVINPPNTAITYKIFTRRRTCCCRNPKSTSPANRFLSWVPMSSAMVPPDFYVSDELGGWEPPLATPVRDTLFLRRDQMLSNRHPPFNLFGMNTCKKQGGGVGSPVTQVNSR